MHRRRFLSGLAIVPFGLGGCLGTGANSNIPDGMTVETHHRVGSHLVDDEIEPSGERPRSYQTIIHSNTVAEERMSDAAEVEEFSKETDFDQSYLVVVVAAAWPSGARLELQEIERSDGGMCVRIVPASPDEVGDDAAVHSLAIRISEEDAGIPGEVAITIDGEAMGTAERN